MPAFCEPRRQVGDRAVHERLAALAAKVERVRELVEPLRLQRLERQVLELPLQLPDPEALGQWGVDLHRLAGDSLLFLGRQRPERAHVVEPVRELDQDDPDVLGHRQEHLSDVLGLLLLVRVGTEFGELRDAVHKAGNLGPELILDVGEAVFGVLRNVVEQRALDRHRVDPEVGEDLRRGDRMYDVRLAGDALLAVVGLHREVERALDGFDVRAGVVLAHRCEEARPEGFEIDGRVGTDRGRGAGPHDGGPGGGRAGRRAFARRVAVPVVAAVAVAARAAAALRRGLRGRLALRRDPFFAGLAGAASMVEREPAVTARRGLRRGVGRPISAACGESAGGAAFSMGRGSMDILLEGYSSGPMPAPTDRSAERRLRGRHTRHLSRPLTRRPARRWTHRSVQERCRPGEHEQAAVDGDRGEPDRLRGSRATGGA